MSATKAMAARIIGDGTCVQCARRSILLAAHAVAQMAGIEENERRAAELGGIVELSEEEKKCLIALRRELLNIGDVINVNA